MMLLQDIVEFVAVSKSLVLHTVWWCMLHVCWIVCWFL